MSFGSESQQTDATRKKQLNHLFITVSLGGIFIWFDFIDMWHCVLIISQLLAFSCEEVLSLK